MSTVILKKDFLNFKLKSKPLCLPLIVRIQKSLPSVGDYVEQVH